MRCKLSILLTLCATLAFAQKGFEIGQPTASILATGSERVILLKPDGTIERTWKTCNNADAWMLANGNVLVADGSAWEATPEGKIVWRYDPADRSGGGLFSCERLANGNTLIGENSTGKVFELTPSGEHINEIQVPLQKNRHQTMRMVRRLKNGNTLVCRSDAHRVVEYNAKGEIVWEQAVPNLAFAAVRDDEGNTYISSLERVQKWSPDHRLLWELDAKTLDLPIRNMTGIQLLDNGNLVIGNYSYQKGKVGIFEVTPEKKVLWYYSSPNGRDRSHMAVQLLDGKPALR